MTHDELVESVLDLAADLGILAHYCTDGRRCKGYPGFPDIVAVGRRGILFAEVKTENGETSAEQDLWRHRIYSLSEKNFVGAMIWRPDDWEDGHIKAHLLMIV